MLFYLYFLSYLYIFIQLTSYNILSNIHLLLEVDANTLSQYSGKCLVPALEYGGSFGGASRHHSSDEDDCASQSRANDAACALAMRSSA